MISNKFVHDLLPQIHNVVSAIILIIVTCMINNYSIFCHSYFVGVLPPSTAYCTYHMITTKQINHELIMTFALMTLVRVCFGTVIYVTQYVIRH